MLTLKREVGESVALPAQGLIVTVAEVRRDRVKLCFTAPQDVEIYRTELLSEEQIEMTTANDHEFKSEEVAWRQDKLRRKESVA